VIKLINKGFLGVISFFIFTNLNCYTNKTYIRSVDSSTYFPEQYSCIDFTTKRERREVDTKANFYFAPFYYSSMDKKDIGRYFGVNEDNGIVLSDRNAGMDVYYEYLIHIRGVGDPVAKVALNPKTVVYGCNFSFLYNFYGCLKKFYAKFNLPVIRVENDLDASFYQDAQTIRNFLAGRYQNLTAGSVSQQEALRNGKIDGKKSSNGISDLDFIVAYEFWFEHNRSVILNLGLTIPTGNEPKGEYLFEPIRGDGGHWGLRGAYEGNYRFYEKNDKVFELFFDLSYKYLFSKTQKRVLGIKGANWGQYYLLGRKGAQNEPLIPAANVLTKNVKVSPGSQLQADIKFLFKPSANFGLTAGYNILFREGEEVKLKDSFLNDTYAVARQNFNTNDRFGYPALDDNLERHIDVAFSNYWLNTKDIDFTAAQNPYSLLHKIYAQISGNCKFDSFVKLATFSLGSSINFLTENSGFDGFSVCNNFFYL
jgi:hypothetical protein